MINYEMKFFVNLYLTAPRVTHRQLSHQKSLTMSVDEPQPSQRLPSPARNPPSNIVHIRNLVRPFTLNQLKELLGRSGPLVAEGFWIDKIKSHCIVTVSKRISIGRTGLKRRVTVITLTVCVSVSGTDF